MESKAKQQQKQQQTAVVVVQQQQSSNTMSSASVSSSSSISPPSSASMNGNKKSKQSVIKKPTRSLEKLKRPSAKLQSNGNRNVKQQNETISGKKRSNNPCENDNDSTMQQPAKKRNPFSRDAGQGGSNSFNDRKKNSTIFTI